MKQKLSVLMLIGLLIGACDSPKAEEEQQDTIAQTVSKEDVKLTGSYGEEISEAGAISTAELLSRIEDNDSVQTKVSGEILATCKMKGCWMNVALPGEDKMRVTFKDYGFFVPKEGVEGKKVIMEGYAKKVTTDVETLKHFAKDAGKSQEEINTITEPREEITFIASGVIIKDKDN